MNKLNIFTGLDLRQQSEAFLCRHFGKVGHYYFNIARAIDERAVNPNRERKSVGSENTFERDLTELAELSQALAPLIDSVWGYCERTGIHGKTVTLKVKFSDFTQITRSRSALSAVATKSLLSRIVGELLESVLPLPQPVRLLGVSLSKLEQQDTVASGQLRLDL